MSSLDQNNNKDDIKDSSRSDIYEDEKVDEQELKEEEVCEIERKKFQQTLLDEKAKDLEREMLWIRKELHDMRQQDRFLSKDVKRITKKVNEIEDLAKHNEFAKNKNTEDKQ